jgi:hypothetical protein
MAYAGGASASACEAAIGLAGQHRWDLAQGAAFAAAARRQAGALDGEYVRIAAALTGADAEAAALRVQAVRDGLDVAAASEAPAYEVWRRRVREQLSEKR